MASYGLNDVRNGLKILIDGDPYVIVDSDFIKPGKGQAFTRIRIRNLKNGRVVEEGPAWRVFEQPEHPYTQALLAAALNLEATGNGVVAI